jgi:preprotein translocase subunit YajC
MENLLVTPAFAQGAPGGGDMNAMLVNIVPFILIFVIMWFLIIRPQQRRVKEHQEMLKNVRRGDTVVTSGGIIGKVTKVTEDGADLDVEIADGVRVKVARAMIAEVRTKGEPVKA